MVELKIAALHLSINLAVEITLGLGHPSIRNKRGPTLPHRPPLLPLP